MKLKTITVCGFRSFHRTPTVIEFEDDLTLFIGANGTGKTAVLAALAKMFGVHGRGVGLEPSDFYLSPEEPAQLERSLFIEAVFSFCELDTADGNHTAVPTCFKGLVCDEEGKLYFRARLEASLTFQGSVVGDVEEHIYTILTLGQEIGDNHRVPLRPPVRNRIQVHYVSATRDPVREIGFSASTIVGRLLKAGIWSTELKDNLRVQTDAASGLLSGHGAVDVINKSAENFWGKYHRGTYLTEPRLRFLPPDLDSLLGQSGISFRPSPGGAETDLSRLSEGERSLFYLALVQMAHNVETEISKWEDLKASFNEDRLRIPAYTLMAVEEPENHLAPHYLSRIVLRLLEFGKTDNAQSIVSTHSASMASRVHPRSLRYLRLDPAGRATRVRRVSLPRNHDDAYNYVVAAIQAYPELLFSRLVILGEGDTERLVLPRYFAALANEETLEVGAGPGDAFVQPIVAADRAVDSTFVSIIPIGGRHVNHFWKLLADLEIPFLTILDLDLGRYQGGWGRIKYAISQLRAINLSGLTEKLNNLDEAPEWDSPVDPTDPRNERLKHLEELETLGVFFSSPLDLDYVMLKALPAKYRELDAGEKGPLRLLDDDGKPIPGRKEELTKGVLKNSQHSHAHGFYPDLEHLDDFSWYRYRFLSRGKPTSHLRALQSIGEAELRCSIPPVLSRLLRRAIEALKALPE